MKSPAWTGHLAGISVLASHYGGKEQRNKRQLGSGAGGDGAVWQTLFTATVLALRAGTVTLPH